MKGRNEYMVLQPIKNPQKQTIGHEILYFSEDHAFDGLENDKESAAANAVYYVLTQNTEKVLKGTLSFMTFTPTLLLKKTPELFDRSDLVIQIDDSAIIHPSALEAVKQYASQGYKIAVNEFRFLPRYMGLLGIVDYLKLSFQTQSDDMLRSVIETGHSLGKTCVAVGIDSEALYAKAVDMGVDAMEGLRVAEKLEAKAHSSGYLQSNFFRLMVAMSRDEPNIKEVEELISVDATLSYALLRLANSGYFARRSRATTVRQAIMTVGLTQLRRWIYLLSASSAETQFDKRSEEFLKRSLLRGTFCSKLMEYASNMPISRSDAYLMGMFSTLNYFIDAPLEEILKEIPIREEVKAALLRHEGRAGLLYDLALNYEWADWNAIPGPAEKLGIPTHLLSKTYFACMEDVNFIWQQLTSSRPEDMV